MAFCSFSKDVDNTYTVIENKFITKYLPEADGFAVKVYLYGLYLCKSHADFDVHSMAEIFKTTEQKIIDAFVFWDDYDLVEILSKDPLTVQYLPVKANAGKPKRVRYEQYTDFNKELQRKMQKVGKFVSPNEYVKYMRFLEENTMQPQALLLIAEYCIRKQGEAISPAYIFNKAKKFLQNGLITYEQVEKELSGYNVNEDALLAIFTALNLPQRNPDESDYALYKKWTEKLGFDKKAILATAKKLKRGSMNSLDLTLDELAEKDVREAKNIEEYLTKRDALANLTFRIGRKLGVKVLNPAPYVDEYTERWQSYGFEESSLLDVALYCMKTGQNDFDSMHIVLQKLYDSEMVSKEAVKAFLKERNEELKFFQKLQEICGNIRKSTTNLAFIKTWRDWNFSEEMITEAAKRSTTSSNPLPYMNRILSDWKEAGVYAMKDIPSAETQSKATGFIPQNVQNLNAKTDRERYYSLLREKAQTKAEQYVAKANANEKFKALSTELSRMELALAKAEVFQPETLPALLEKKASLLSQRKEILSALGIDEAQLQPQFTCKKCSDTGFLPSGAACNCYKA